LNDVSERGGSTAKNGKPVDPERIDGGFMGVYLDAGTSEVRLASRVPNQGVYAGVSAAAFGAYALVNALSACRKRKSAIADV